MRGNFEYMSNGTALDIIDQAVRRINRRFEDYGDADDLRQEAHVFVATKADLQEALEAEEYGLFQHRLEMDLTDHIKKEVRRTERNVSYEALRDQNPDGTGGEDTHVKPYVIIETTSNDYTRDSVESLLPAVWDDLYAYGLPNKDTVPDPDMPKAQVDASRGNDLSAYIADIRSGWKKTPLTHKERCAVLLAFGLGWTPKDIAYNQEVSRQAIETRIETAVGKIAARLNGGYRYEPAA